MPNMFWVLSKGRGKHGPCPGEPCIIERAVSALSKLRALRTNHSSHSENCLRLKGVPGIMQTTPTTAMDGDLFNLPRATAGSLEEIPQCPLIVCSNCCNSSWNYEFFPNIYTKCSLLQPQAILLMRVFDACSPSEHPLMYLSQPVSSAVQTSPGLPAFPCRPQHFRGSARSSSQLACLHLSLYKWTLNTGISFSAFLNTNHMANALNASSTQALWALCKPHLWGFRTIDTM